MEKIGILLLRPEGDDPSPMDQSLGAGLSAGPHIALQEQYFRRNQPGDLENKTAFWQGLISGVVGALQVGESRRLGEVAERMNILCFVANNNPAVWQKRRHVFHIGLPTLQTTAAIANSLVQNTNRRRILLLHDDSEFQSRVAANMEAALAERGVEARSKVQSPMEPLELDRWKPELIYLIFSSERKALPIARAIRECVSDIPILFGRSLLRESFLTALADQAGEFWFVDNIFRHSRSWTASQQHFMRVMAENRIAVPTTNHAFGWDAMKFCAHALAATRGDSLAAIDYLESGVALEGASGTCFFNPDNHNGRLGAGPTVLTRWRDRRLEPV
jgi:ABC-type branched-subunit amino acid transport system substrate-binding protein